MPTSARSRSILKISVILVIAGAFAGIFFSPLRHQLNIAAAHQFVATMRGKVESLWWAPLAFIGGLLIGMVVLTSFVKRRVAPKTTVCDADAPAEPRPTQ